MEVKIPINCEGAEAMCNCVASDDVDYVVDYVSDSAVSVVVLTDTS